MLLAAFGVAIPEARGGLSAVEESVRERYPGCVVEWAFTAHKVRRKMKRRGYHAVSVAEALSRLHDEGVTHLAVQSLHTVPGVEYHWTRDQAEVYRHPRKGFLEVRMGGPLLESEDDLQRTRAALADYIPAERKPEEAVVLVGHGTYHAGHQRYLDFQECVRHADPKLFVGALMGKPGCGEILEFLQAAGAERVWLLPFMSVAGHHVRVDIYGDHPRSWKSRMIAAGFTVETRLTGTLEHPGFRDIWLDHLRKATAALMG
ncbi:MAG: sirohydrochlorin cobaltochelatase [Desulfococcaceae bacterium]